MTLAQAKARHEKLAAEIRRHDTLYYVEARPEISDYNYDQLYQELQDIESKHPELITPQSPTQRVAGKPSEGFKRVVHKVPMLSLEKIKAADHPTTAEQPDVELRKRQQDEKTLDPILYAEGDVNDAKAFIKKLTDGKNEKYKLTNYSTLLNKFTILNRDIKK